MATHSNNHVQDVMCYDRGGGILRYKVVRSDGETKSNISEQQMLGIIESGRCGPSVTVENLRKLEEMPLQKWLLDDVLGELRKIAWKGKKFVCHILIIVG